MAFAVDHTRNLSISMSEQNDMQTITPCLWFDSNAEKAVNFYTSIFKNSKIGNISRYGEAGYEIHGKPAGTVLTIEFELNGQKFTALNGGPIFRFNEAISFQVYCESQEEVDYFWDRLSEGGDEKAQQCGWLKDKFGLSWQIVPTLLIKLLQDKDAEKSGRVMQAMLQMKKIDIRRLQQAYEES
jgi:predicted 3-demethylubiquinone-9 3-methyltransferase (glyoxalase superfamily)